MFLKASGPSCYSIYSQEESKSSRLSHLLLPLSSKKFSRVTSKSFLKQRKGEKHEGKNHRHQFPFYDFTFCCRYCLIFSGLYNSPYHPISTHISILLLLLRPPQGKLQPVLFPRQRQYRHYHHQYISLLDIIFSHAKA